MAYNAPETATRALSNGKLTLDESRQLLRMYVPAAAHVRGRPSGYTYLEREVDASFVAGHGQQLRLVAPETGAANGGKAPVPPTGTGS